MARVPQLVPVGLLCVLASGACAGSADTVTRRTDLPPLTEAQAQLFDDGVDLVEDPLALEGTWQEDWEQDVERRLAESDEIAFGTVRTAQADVDLSRRTSYRVLFAVERVVKGELGTDVTLTTAEGAAGYASMERYRERLLQRRFVAFIKRAGRDEPHFHLTPPSPALTRRLDKYEAAQRPNTIKIIEHRHDE